MFRYLFHKPALVMAIEKKCHEIIKYLLTNENIDINLPHV